MPNLLVVHHTPSPSVRELLEGAVAGATLPELDEVSLQVEPALSATAADLLAADALLMLTPANIGYMSGALKHFFDTVYYPCLDATRGLPYAVIVHGNNDTGGAVRAVQKIAEALQWRAVAAPLQVTGAPDREQVLAAQEVGSVVAAAAADIGVT